ncbi:fucose-1-phosphate guanylyltransferase-like isoform X2 [Ornithodoros turicata]
MGSGGSTLHILESLEARYSSSLFEMKILLIHAGGQSRRLPSHSVLGKLFSLLPVLASAVVDMLDLKLALYLPFLTKMKPGIFLTCSDDIETYALFDWDKAGIKNIFEAEGFTALAHPSTIDVGTTHGVYVLPPDVQATESCTVTSCLEVLQKPSVELMQSKGAVVKVQRKDSADEEFVYTDSAFFFGTKVMRTMLQYYKAAKPISTEIDAYKDFLEKLGSRSHVPTDKWSAGDVLTPIQDALAQFPLQVLVIPKSRFYHIGTMSEYIDNFTTNQQFVTELGLSKFTNSTFVDNNGVNKTGLQCLTNVEGVIMHSKIHPNSTIGATVVIEHCKFLVPIHVEQNCILSNCEVTSAPGEELCIPDHSIFFTASVRSSHLSGFVTVSFGIGDDLKCTSKSSKDVSYFGASLYELESLEVMPMRGLFENSSSDFSLWDAKLFEVKETMTDAFHSTLNLTRAITNREKTTVSFNQRISMKDVLNWKCVEKVLAYQDEIFI